MKVAIILGGGRKVWDELALSRELAPDAPILACNHAARDHDGPVAAWVTMHPELLPHWQAERAAAGRPPADQLWTTNHRVSPIKTISRIRTPGGSSGLLCVYVGLELGFDRMMLCGVPMCQNDCHYDDTRKWHEASNYLPAWRRALPKIQDKVRSFGGQTFHFLGAPTKAWLDGTERRRTKAA